MISPEERAAIERAAAQVDMSGWLVLSEAERDLVSRALAPRPEPERRAS